MVRRSRSIPLPEPASLIRRSGRAMQATLFPECDPFDENALEGQKHNDYRQNDQT
jgi:hypothetical protein